MRIIKNPKTINKCLAQYNVYDFISDKRIEVFAVQYEAGEYLRHPGSSHGTNWLQFVISGIINLYIISPDGKIISKRYGEWHSHIGESEMILKRDLEIFAKADSEVTVLAIDTSIYRERLLNDNAFLRNALESTAEILFLNIMENINQDSLKVRTLNAMQYKCPNGILSGVELHATVFHCSARQLQRVLNELVAENRIKKIGKGKYQYEP